MDNINLWDETILHSTELFGQLCKDSLNEVQHNQWHKSEYERNKFIGTYISGYNVHCLNIHCEKHQKNLSVELVENYNFSDLQTAYDHWDLYRSVNLYKHPFIAYMGIDYALKILPDVRGGADGIFNYLDHNSIINEINIYSIMGFNLKEKIKEINKFHDLIEESLWDSSDENFYLFNSDNGGVVSGMRDFESLSLHNLQYSRDTYLKSKILKHKLVNQIKLVNGICKHLSDCTGAKISVALQGDNREIMITLQDPFALIIVEKNRTVHLSLNRIDLSGRKIYAEAFKLDKHFEKILEFKIFEDFEWLPWRPAMLEYPWNYDKIIFDCELAPYYSKFFATKKHTVSSIAFNGRKIDKNAHVYSRLKYTEDV